MPAAPGWMRSFCRHAHPAASSTAQGTGVPTVSASLRSFPSGCARPFEGTARVTPKSKARRPSTTPMRHSDPTSLPSISTGSRTACTRSGASAGSLNRPTPTARRPTPKPRRKTVKSGHAARHSGCRPGDTARCPDARARFNPPLIKVESNFCILETQPGLVATIGAGCYRRNCNAAARTECRSPHNIRDCAPLLHRTHLSAP